MTVEVRPYVAGSAASRAWTAMTMPLPARVFRTRWPTRHCAVCGTPLRRGPTDHHRKPATKFVTVEIMIRDQGVETLRGHPKEAIFYAVATKSNWPTVAGVRIGPEDDLLVAGGRVRAELHLLGMRLSVAGVVTKFEPGALIEATGCQGGISATMMVRFADNADDPNRRDPVNTTVNWRFEACLPKRRAMLELPAAAAIKAAIPLLRVKFINNIIQQLAPPPSAEVGPSVAGTIPRAANESKPGQLPAGDAHSESSKLDPPTTPQ